MSKKYFEKETNEGFRVNFKISNFFDPMILSRVLAEIKERIKGGYKRLLEEIVKQIRDYYVNESKKCNLKMGKLKFLIGFSGGVDSTVTTYLAVRAVSNEVVIPITMPMKFNYEECKNKINLVSKCLGINHKDIPSVIPIEEIVNKEIETINNLEYNKLKINTDLRKQSFDDKIRIGNFASRARISILFDLSRRLNAKVLGTGNKTEYYLGYATKFGTPFSCDYGVLNELYKIDIYELAKLLNIPKEIIKAVPSTGFYPGQTHEKELGATLEELDAIVYLLFEKKLNPKKVIDNYDVSPSFVKITLDRSKRAIDKFIPQHIHLSFIEEKKNVS